MSEPTAEAGVSQAPNDTVPVSDAEAQEVAAEATKEVDAVNGDAAEQAAKEEAGEGSGAQGEQSKGDTQESTKMDPMLKTTAKIDRKDHASNRKFDPSVLPETDDPEKIRTQVEFYFGDSNLPNDKYMWNLTGGEENKPVKLKDICSFKRMRRFQPYSAVVAALKDSRVLNVSGSDGEEVVNRKKAYAIASDNSKTRMASSVYVKGFGDEEPSTQFEIEAFFARYGPVNAIRLRRTEENLFKGSVFAEFQSEELAKKFLALDPPPEWKGHELKIMSKRAYVDEKTKLIQEGKIEASNSKPKRFFQGKEVGGRGNFRGRGRGGQRSGGDSDDWKKRRDEDRKNGFRDRRNQRGRGGHNRRGRGGRDRGNERDGGKGDSTEAADAATKEPAEQSATGKRAREDDGESAPPAKKVDTKSEEAASS